MLHSTLYSNTAVVWFQWDNADGSRLQSNYFLENLLNPDSVPVWISLCAFGGGFEVSSFPVSAFNINVLSGSHSLVKLVRTKETRVSVILGSHVSTSAFNKCNTIFLVPFVLWLFLFAEQTLITIGSTKWLRNIKNCSWAHQWPLDGCSCSLLFS